MKDVDDGAANNLGFLAIHKHGSIKARHCTPIIQPAHLLKHKLIYNKIKIRQFAMLFYTKRRIRLKKLHKKEALRCKDTDFRLALSASMTISF